MASPAAPAAVRGGSSIANVVSRAGVPGHAKIVCAGIIDMGATFSASSGSPLRKFMH